MGTTAIYCRQSLDRDRNQLAVERQREDLLKLCAEKGWETPVEFIDNSVSATKGTRPAYSAMCSEIEAGNTVRPLAPTCGLTAAARPIRWDKSTPATPSNRKSHSTCHQAPYLHR